MKQIDLNNEIVIYQSEDGKTQLDVKLEGETVWLRSTRHPILAMPIVGIAFTTRMYNLSRKHP